MLTYADVSRAARALYIEIVMADADFNKVVRSLLALLVQKYKY
jgi:hypothetical protein